MTLEKPARKLVVGCAFVLIGAACGGGGPADDTLQASKERADKGAASQGDAAKEAKKEAGVAANEAGTAKEKPAREKAAGETLEPAEAKVGSKEITNMMPADGKNRTRPSHRRRTPRRA